jgi:hypothetical protein
MSLFRRGETSTACRMFEESYAMDAAPGTLFNLAICHEAEGRLADAYRELDLLAVRAESTGRADKAETVRARATALQPRLARVDLKHRASPRSEATAVSIDDTPLLAGEWSRPQYVAPTAHAVHVHFADGSEITRNVGPLVARSTTTVLLEEPAAPPSERPERVGAATAPAAPAPPEMSPRRRTALHATTAAGATLVVAGTAFGVLAIVKRNDGVATCTNGVCSSTMTQGDAYDDRHAGKVLATLSTVSFAAAGATLIGSVVLYFTRHAPEPSSASAWRLSPAADARSAGLLLGGSF